MTNTATVIDTPARRLPALVLVGLLAGPFLTMVDSNIVNVAIPQIGSSLHAPLESVQWTVSAYLLAIGSALAATAWLTRRLGDVTIYTASLAGFTLASAICAFAPTIQALIAARALQGIAGAALVPVAMGMLLGGGENPNRRGIPASAGIVLFLGPALGPTLGGLLIAAFGWPSIFLVNVPFGVLGILGARRIPASMAAPADRTVRLDLLGVTLLAAGLALALYGAGQGPVHGWLSAGVAPYYVAGAVLLALYAVHAFSTESPAIDLRLLTNAPAASSFALCLVVSVVTFGVLFLVPVFMQTVQGHTALVAGLTLLPQGIVMGLGTVAGMKVVERGYVRWSCIGGSILLVATTAALLLLDRATPAWETAAILSARGLALGLIIQPLLQALMGRLPRAELPDANTLFNVIQRVGGSFGIALLGTFFQHRETVRVQAVLPRRDLVGQALVSGFHDTLWVLVALAGLAFLLSLALRGTSRLE